MDIQDDRLFAERYPQGQFIIIRSDNHYFPNKVQLYWRWGRRIGRGIGCRSHEIYHPTIYKPNLTPNDMGLGRRTYYKTLEKMLKAAEKFNLPADLIAMFVQDYNARHEILERQQRILE